MLRTTSVPRVRYQPYAMAVQVRFKWRHRVDENWRRLMDASCFCVDWQGRPRYNTISQFGGHWSHFITCAHVISPWDYPNFYPPIGATRFVSKITATDCEVQLRQPSLQGDIVYKTFASKFTTYIHRNPRLDLAVVHVEQALRRTQEMKMLWMQNEGFHVRPRFELLEDIKEGDTVWIYGCTARGDIFDEESRLEPLMVPTGVRGVVRLVNEEHFFVDTSGDELSGNVQMGMCGAAVMRNGKLVGMLTATVAASNDDTRVANCAMCTHARDIRAFLLEVERQMKTAPPPVDDSKPTMFQERRRQEEQGGAAARANEPKDWEADEMRLARHVKVPFSLWRMEEQWTCEEDRVSSSLFGPSGTFSREVQEEGLGLHMQDARDDGKAPEGFELVDADGNRPQHTSNRPDRSPANVYVSDTFVTNENYDGPQTDHVKDFYRGAMGAQETEQMDNFKRSVDAANQARAREELHQSALNLEQARAKAAAESFRSTAPLKPPPSQQTSSSSSGAAARDPAAAERREELSRTEERFRKFRNDGDDLDDIWGKH